MHYAFLAILRNSLTINEYDVAKENAVRKCRTVFVGDLTFVWEKYIGENQCGNQKPPLREGYINQIFMSRSNNRKAFLKLMLEMSENGLMQWNQTECSSGKWKWIAYWGSYRFECDYGQNGRKMRIEIWAENGRVMAMTVVGHEKEILQDSMWSSGQARTLLNGMRSAISGGTAWNTAKWACKQPGSAFAATVAFGKTWKAIGFYNSIIYWQIIKICAEHPERMGEWAEIAAAQAKLYGDCGDKKGEKSMMDLCTTLRAAYRQHLVALEASGENEIRRLESLSLALAKALHEISEYAGEITQYGEVATVNANWLQEFAKETLRNLGIRVERHLTYQQ